MEGQESQEKQANTPKQIKHERASDFADKLGKRSSLAAEEAMLRREGVNPDSAGSLATDAELENIRAEIERMRSSKSRKKHQENLSESTANHAVRLEVKKAKAERESRTEKRRLSERRGLSLPAKPALNPTT